LDEKRRKSAPYGLPKKRKSTVAVQRGEKSKKESPDQRAAAPFEEGIGKRDLKKTQARPRISKGTTGIPTLS